MDTDVSGSSAAAGSWASFTAPPAAVPTVSEWTFLLMTLLLAAGSMIMLERRRARAI